MPKAEGTRWELNYIDEGSGPVVVLLHGLAGDHRAWLPQIAALKPSYRVIALDNPGSGLSAKVTEPTTLKEIAADVTRLLEGLGIRNAHFVGRSMGGAIAQELAIANPSLVTSLALAGSFAKLDALGTRLIENMRDYIQINPDWVAWTRQFSFTFVSPDFFLADAERLARLEGIIGDKNRDRTSYVNLANACLASNTVGRLRDLRCPILIMAGSLDPICSPLTTRWLSDEASHAEVQMFEDSSHFFLMEEQDKANAVILDWVARHERG